MSSKFCCPTAHCLTVHVDINCANLVYQKADTSSGVSRSFLQKPSRGFAASAAAAAPKEYVALNTIRDNSGATHSVSSRQISEIKMDFKAATIIVPMQLIELKLTTGCLSNLF